MRRLVMSAWILAVVPAFPPVSAAPSIPDRISLQGRLTSDVGNPVDGTRQMIFRLYDVPSGGEAAWTEYQDVGVVGGLYQVFLGDVDVDIGGLAFDRPYYLGVSVGGDPEMTPRYRLTTSPYAMRAKWANGADRLGLQYPSQYLRSDADDQFTFGTLTLSPGTTLSVQGSLALPSAGITGGGAGSGLDADRLDGQHASAFAGASHGHAVSDLSGMLLPGNGGTGQDLWLQGDLLYASATNTLARRSLGSPGQVLTVSGGLPVWSNATGITSLGTLTSLAVGGTSTLGETDLKGHLVMKPAIGMLLHHASFAGAVQTLSGSATITAAAGRAALNSGSTDGSVADLTDHKSAWSVGDDQFRTGAFLSARVHCTASPVSQPMHDLHVIAGGYSYFSGSTKPLGDGFGFRIRGSTFHGVVYNGGVETSLDLGGNFSNYVSGYALLAVVRSATSVEFYVDGVSRGTLTAALPTNAFVYSLYELRASNGAGSTLFADIRVSMLTVGVPMN